MKLHCRGAAIIVQYLKKLLMRRNDFHLHATHAQGSYAMVVCLGVEVRKLRAGWLEN